jgi:hypothetical protein
VATSRLFNPRITEKRGDALDRTDELDMFQNIPLHPSVPNFTGPTDRGEPCHPLRLTSASQQFTKGAEKRPISSSPQEDTKY